MEEDQSLASCWTKQAFRLNLNRSPFQPGSWAVKNRCTVVCHSLLERTVPSWKRPTQLPDTFADNVIFTQQIHWTPIGMTSSLWNIKHHSTLFIKIVILLVQSQSKLELMPSPKLCQTTLLQWHHTTKKDGSLEMDLRFTWLISMLVLSGPIFSIIQDPGWNQKREKLFAISSQNLLLMVRDSKSRRNNSWTKEPLSGNLLQHSEKNSNFNRNKT